MDKSSACRVVSGTKPGKLEVKYKSPEAQCQQLLAYNSDQILV